MSIFPYSRVTIESNHDKEVLMQKLADNLAPIASNYFKGGFSFNYKRVFEGHLSQDSFYIRRQIKSMNSFLPMINGNFQQNKIGSKVKIRMRVHAFFTVILILWTIGMLTGLIATWSSMIKENRFDGTILFFIVMLIFGYSLVMLTFNYEKTKAIKELTKIFDGKVV
jgi:hypothetical protein